MSKEFLSAKFPIVKIKANQIMLDVFIWNFAHREIIFVDDVDIHEWKDDGIKYRDVVITSEFFTENGYHTIETRIDPDEDVYIIMNYPLDDKQIFLEANKTKHFRGYKNVKFTQKQIKNYTTPIENK